MVDRRLPASDVIDVITEAIAPYLGPAMARSAVLAHVQKLGCDGGELAPDQVDALVARIGAGLNIFVGRDRSGAILEEVRSALRKVGP